MDEPHVRTSRTIRVILEANINNKTLAQLRNYFGIEKLITEKVVRKVVQLNYNPYICTYDKTNNNQ
jgi:hypothetical protein